MTATETVAQMVAKKELSEKHLEVLRVRAISDSVIATRGYRTVNGRVGALELTKLWSKAQLEPSRYPALAYPVNKVGKAHTYVLRPDHPRTFNPKSASPKIVKYEYPKGAGQAVDVLPYRKGALGDPGADLWITEGILKADALTSVGVLAAAINGVYGWRGSNDKGGKMIVPDLEAVALNRRRVVLAFDSDMVRNANVMQAARRFGAWAGGKGAHMDVLMLPQKGDDKTGVDDYLASLPLEQRTVAALEQYVVPLSDGTRTFTDRFGTTSEGEELLNPPGYQNRQGPLTYTNPETGRNKTIYNGYIAVTARGHDAETQESTLTVTWRDGEKSEGALTKTITVPQAEIATARGVIKALASRGATVHERNAKELSEFLIEFARVNSHALEYRLTTNKYGYSGEGIVGPGWSVGTNASYNGHAPITIRRSGADEYRAALREAAQWDAAPLMLALGFAVISPHLERLRTVRNPVMWLSGNSNYGKTSVVDFAVGLYGDPKQLSIQSGRSTWAGFTQRLQYLRGLPVAFDEAQTADPVRLQNVVYQHANGQTYAKGGADGQPLGNEALSGSVFVAGEAPPQLTFKGAQNRIIDIRAGYHKPLGIAPDETPRQGALSGQARSSLLKKAVANGAGALGEQITSAIWNEWDAFVSAVDMGEAQLADVTDGAREWLRPLVAAQVGLAKLFEVCGVPTVNYPQGLALWAHGTLCAARRDNDPAREAFEALRALVVNAATDLSDSHVRVLRGERVAVEAGSEWYVLQNSDPVKKVLEPYGGLQGLASQWVQRGWVTADADGKNTARRSIKSVRQRVLVLPHEVVHSGTEEADKPD